MTSNRAALGALILLAGTTTSTVAIEANYTCTTGTRLTADFSTPGTYPGSVVLTIAGTSGKITLPQAMSADGGRYANDTMEFWIKGTGATLTRGGKSETCRSK